MEITCSFVNTSRTSCGKPLEVQEFAAHSRATDIPANYQLKPDRFIICLARLMVVKVTLFFDLIFQLRYFKSEASTLSDRNFSTRHAQSFVTFEK